MVTAPEELCKQPFEKRKYTMEFSALLATSEIISSIDGITSEKMDGSASDLDITSSGIVDGNATDSKISMWIEGGSDNSTYRIEVRVNTSGGQKLEGDSILIVRDR